jgi:hypothetical protein
MKYEERAEFEKEVLRFGNELRCQRVKKSDLPEKIKNFPHKNESFGNTDRLRYLKKEEVPEGYADDVADFKPGEYAAVEVRLGFSKPHVFSLKTRKLLDCKLTLDDVVGKVMVAIKNEISLMQENHDSCADLCYSENLEERLILHDSIGYLKKNSRVPKDAGDIIKDTGMNISKDKLNRMLRFHAQKGYWGVDRNIVMLADVMDKNPTYVFDSELVQKIEKEAVLDDEEFPKLWETFKKKENWIGLESRIDKSKRSFGSKQMAETPTGTLFDMAYKFSANGCGRHEISREQYSKKYGRIAEPGMCKA